MTYTWYMLAVTCFVIQINQAKGECTADQFSCDNGKQCVRKTDFCDAASDCSDASDEPYRNDTNDSDGNITYCRRPTYFSRSDSSVYVICRLPPQLQSHKSELCLETDNCPKGSFSCQNGYQCIPMRYFCTGEVQCSDGSDEPYRNDTNDLDGNVTYCRRVIFFSQTNLSAYLICRLPTYLQSRRSELCFETNNCPKDSFSCQNGYQCIPMRYYCDGFIHCSDRSDELYWNAYDLGGNITYCRRPSLRDHAVEFICRLPTYLLLTKSDLCLKPDACSRDSFSCANEYQCVPSENFYNGDINCNDASDEWEFQTGRIKTAKEPCPCGEFPCADGKGCFIKRAFCDGNWDCSDGSDELYRNTSFNTADNFTYCRQENILARVYSNLASARICRIPTHLIPYRSELCPNGIETCTEAEFSCTNGYECLPSRYFCDGQTQCSDLSDEPYRNISLSQEKNVTYCRCDMEKDFIGLRRGSFICEMPKEADLIKDRCTCPEVGYTMEEFPCRNAYQNINLDGFCNGEMDCRDNSDEWPSLSDVDMKTRVTCFEDDRNCSLPKELFGVTSCRTQATSCGDGQFSCGNSSWCIPMAEFCTANEQCPSGEDEQRADFFTERKCESKVGGFEAYIACTIPDEFICDGTADCDKGTDECLCSGGISKVLLDDKCFRCLYATSHVIPLSEVCDGTIDCPDASDECLCGIEARPSNCTDLAYQNLNLTGLLEQCIGCDKISMDMIYLRCKNSSLSIRQRRICDGQADCPDATDEIACENRFYCTDQPLPHIPMRWRCNKIENCEDGRDEHNCSHFLCNDGGDVKYLDTNQVCNRIQDCRDGSDECQAGCVNSAFSDEVSMIKNKGILAFVFIFSLASVAGCLSILFITAKKIHGESQSTKEVGRHRANVNAKISNSLIMSLSISDLLVGIYAFSICIKSFELEGRYCLEDQKWRASQACSFFGALLIIGSEQSVLTMLLITFQRLRGVLWSTFVPKAKPIYRAMIITWTISLMLGIIPTLSIAEDYFLDDITFRDNPMFTTIKKYDVQYMTRWLSLMHNGTIPPSSTGATTWDTLVNLVSELNPNYTAIHKYGYYSSHTVCLPSFFPNPVTDNAWGYSLFLLVINFVSFLIILISYIVMYRKATAETIATTSKAGNENNNTRMQVKMTLIVATDFLCWMPICIMGFMRVGGVEIPNDAYLPAGLLIIPINSALNPFLYSRMSDIIWDKTSSSRESVAIFFREIPRACFRAIEDLRGPGDGDHEIEETTV